MSQEKYEVTKKEFLEFQINKKELDMAKIDEKIEALKAEKIALTDEIRAIKENNRDIFPARGRKKAN